nr:MAG TPA: hypothetical protein [Caudoviricetes sp.]
MIPIAVRQVLIFSIYFLFLYPLSIIKRYFCV